MKWTEIATAIVAAYGAILATVTFIYQLWSTRPRLKVDIAWGMAPSSTSDIFITVIPRNRGLKSVTLNQLGFLVGETKAVVPVPRGTVSFPHELQPESSCTMLVNGAELAAEFGSHGFSGEVELVGYVEDAIGRTYRSKPMKTDLNVLMRGPNRRD